MGAYVMTLTADAVENNIILLVRQRIYTAELRVKICAVIGNVGQCIVYLIVYDDVAVVCVFERYARSF